MTATRSRASARIFGIIAGAIAVAVVAIAVIALSSPGTHEAPKAAASTAEVVESSSQSQEEAPAQAPARKAVFSAADEALLAKAKKLPELDELLACEDLSFELLPRSIMAMRDKGLDAEAAVELVAKDKDHVPADKIDWSALYTSTVSPVANPKSLTACVNKEHPFGASYVPSDLVNLPIGYYGAEGSLRKEAADAVVALIDACERQGYGEFYAMSNYRSYEDQAAVYSNYVSMHGQASADRFSARAGFSEHQSGLATDFGVYGGSIVNFNQYAGYEWVLEHAADYGFILRFPNDREFITGYEHENWHFRYVGAEAARIISSHGWTLEEYSILFD